jgi:hypothetical protein
MNAQAYYSDPEHNRSFIGRWVWIYRGKGCLELTGGKLHFTCQAFDLDLAQRQVQSISLGTFARTAKPISLRFLDLGFVTVAGEARHLYIVPLLARRWAWLTPVWKTNKVVTEWLEVLKEWLAEPGASPNGGPATQLGNSGVTDGPPLVS